MLVCVIEHVTLRGITPYDLWTKGITDEAVSPSDAITSWVAGAIPSCKLSPAKVRLELLFFGFIIFFHSIPLI